MMSGEISRKTWKVKLFWRSPRAIHGSGSSQEMSQDWGLHSRMKHTTKVRLSGRRYWERFHERGECASLVTCIMSQQPWTVGMTIPIFTNGKDPSHTADQFGSEPRRLCF